MENIRTMIEVFEIRYPRFSKNACKYYDAGDEYLIAGLNDDIAIKYDSVMHAISKYNSVDEAFRSIDQVHPETEEEWLMIFKKKLFRQMCRCGYNNTKLAEAVGVSDITISRYTRGLRIPNVFILSKIADVLNCDIEYLTNL